MKPTRRIEISEQVMLCLPESYTKPLLRGLDGWVKALRSGDYKQGRNLLCYEGAYCCLGVLCKLQGRPKSHKVDGLHFRYDGNGKVLSSDNPLYGLLQRDGAFPDGTTGRIDGVDNADGVLSLTYLNDNGVPFTDIATVLELLWLDPDDDDSQPQDLGAADAPHS